MSNSIFLLSPDNKHRMRKSYNPMLFLVLFITNSLSGSFVITAIIALACAALCVKRGLFWGLLRKTTLHMDVFAQDNAIQNW